MSMRPQDVLVAVKLALAPPQTRPTYPELAAALEMSLSEVHGAVKRATAAGLVDSNRRANRVALLDFLVQGLKSAFVPKRGPLTRGMPTAHGAPPLDQIVGLGAEPPPVWPDPDGTVRGESFEPLYRSVPKAAKKDPKLYEALCLIDALRGGRPRDRALAEEYLRRLMLPASASEPPSLGKFSRNEPRRRRIEEALSRTIGPGTAEFYRSAIELLAAEHPVPATSHLVAHLASEIESSTKNLILDVMAATPATKGKQKTQRERPLDGSHAESIQSVLAWLEIPIDGAVGKDWLGLVGKDNEEAFSKRRHRDALEPPRPIDWTFWARFEGILATVLEAFETKYMRVFERLDQLAAKTAPTEEDAEQLRGRMPQNPVAQGYFFGKLSEPAWIEPLEKVGFFATPPEPIRGPGSVEYPGWPALHYLSRMAQTSPDDVARVALAVPRTENIHVRAALVGIAKALPAKLAQPFADRIDDWLIEGEHPIAYPLVDNAIGLLEKFATEGYEKAALCVLAALLRPISPPEQEDFRRDPEARIPNWDLGRTMARLLPTIQNLGEPALGELVKLLAQALAMDHRNGTDKWEDYEDHHDTLRDHLVSATRDSAIRIIESNPSRLSEVIALCEKQRWVFFRRLALTLLQRFYAAAPDLAVAWTLDRPYLDLTGPEYARLLRVSFKSLSPGQQETILSWIDAGPNFPDASDSYADTWRMCRLAVIAEFLPEDWRRKYEALIEKYGDVPAADAETPSHQPFVGPTSPFRDEELAPMTPAQVVDTVRSWKPSSEFGSPEPEGLSRTLERVVGQKPDHYAVAAQDLKRLDPVYLPGALCGFAAAVQAGRAFDWKPVVDLCSWATSHPRKISSRETPPFDDNAHWGNARFAALRLLSSGMDSKSVPIPVEARDRVWAAIVPTLDDPDGAQESEGEQGDPMSRSLNRVSGVAVRAAIDYARWLARKTGSKGLPDEVRRALDAKVSESSPAVRAAMVDQIGALAYLDDAWCESHIRELFKPDEQGRDHAWETYLKYDRLLSLDVFRVLRWRYRSAIDELRNDVVLDKRNQELAEQIGNHLARLYWHGQIAFGERDKVLDKFLSNAPGSVTGEFMENIGHWLHTDGQPTPEVLARLKALWAKRFAIARPEELATFSWWFSSGCFEEIWSIDNYLAALQALDVSAAGFPPCFAPKVDERLAELVPRHLAKVVSCLDLIVRANESGWAILSLRVSARIILSAAVTSDDNEVRKVAKTTISRLARKGYTEFRDLL
jgi:hypothetical protein